MRNALALALLLLPVSGVMKLQAQGSPPVPVCSQHGVLGMALLNKNAMSTPDTVRHYVAGSADTIVVPDKAPELKNPQAVRVALLQHYPRALMRAGVGGTVEVAFVIDTVGNVSQARVRRMSGVPELDAAALHVVRNMQFTAAVYRGCRIRSWTSYPVRFFTAP